MAGHMQIKVYKILVGKFGRLMRKYWVNTMDLMNVKV